MVELPLVLLTGATGYVGGLLLPIWEKQSMAVRCLARNPDRIHRSRIHRSRESTQVVRGDVLDAASLEQAMRGVGTAYYLVHLMSGSKDFEQDDRQAARTFAAAAKKAGVQRIIYLGGLGDDSDPKLSPHLRSRHEVGDILRESGAEVIEFRAGMIVGAGSLSFDLLKALAGTDGKIVLMILRSKRRFRTQAMKSPHPLPLKRTVRNFGLCPCR